MKTIVIYNSQYAESIASAAKVLIENKSAEAIDIFDVERMKELTKGSGNIIHRMVDDVDQRHFKCDKVIYQAKPKDKNIRRVIEAYGDNEVPYAINILGGNHPNINSDVFKAGVVADMSNLLDQSVLYKWELLLKNNLDIINSIKASGEPIVRYNNIMAQEVKVNSPKKEKKS